MNYTRKNLKYFTVIAAVVTSILGVLFHSAYDFFNQNAAAGLFFPINESTWEHLKLIYFPMLICLSIGAVYFTCTSNPKPSKCYGCPASNKYGFFSCYAVGSVVGVYAGCLSVTTLFYTLTSLFREMPDWVNIAIYFVSVFIAYVCFYCYASKPLDNDCQCHNQGHTKKYGECCGIPVWAAALAIIVLCILFFVFTFNAPDIPLFSAP